MGIKQLYNDNLWKLPNEYGDVSVMQTLAAIVHTISIVKKIAKDGDSCILMPFCVKKLKSNLATYCIANIVPNKKNNA